MLSHSRDRLGTPEQVLEGKYLKQRGRGRTHVIGYSKEEWGGIVDKRRIIIR